MDTDKTAREYVFKRRTLLKKAARAAYAFYRIAVTFFGVAIAFLYALTPSVGFSLVPDFALYIFMVILGLLWISEIIFRMAQYSSDVYCNGDTCDKVSAAKETPLVIRFGLNFPFRGLHLFLAAIWFGISFYYLILSAIAAPLGTLAILCPENFLFSFYVVSGACALDFLAKGIFIFRIPALGKFMAEVASTALKPKEGWLLSLMGKLFRTLFK
jgi:hypothetical protein